MRQALYPVFFILSLILLAACARYTPTINTQTPINSFPKSPGKWWHKSYTSKDCSKYDGFSGYVEITGKTRQINDTVYHEMLWITNSEYKVSKRGMLKEKQMSMVGIRHEAGKYYLHSDLLVEQGSGEQLLFDINASIGDSWSMKWRSKFITYDFTLIGKTYHTVLADTLYTFSAKQSPTASHIPEIRSMIFSPKLGVVGHEYEDMSGKFITVREDIAPESLMNICN